MKLITLTIATLTYLITFSQNELSIQSDSTTANFYYVSEETAGTISNCKINIQISDQPNGINSISGSAQIDNLSTNNTVRDKHLKSKTYFNIKGFPEIKFSSNDFHIITSEEKEEWATCKGILELKGFKKEVIFKIYKGNNKLTFKTEVYADDFGVAIKKGRENSLVNIEIPVYL